MPGNVNESDWNKAKELAKEQGLEGNYAYVMGIYNRISGQESCSCGHDHLLEDEGTTISSDFGDNSRPENVLGLHNRPKPKSKKIDIGNMFDPTPKYESYFKLEELTLKDWNTPSAQMPIIKNTVAKRKKVKGKEIRITRFLDIEGKASSPILIFGTEPTFKFSMPYVNNGNSSTSGDTNTYLMKIQLVDFNKWRKGKYLHEMNINEFKEILDVCEIKLDCQCKFFFWGGLNYVLGTIDSAIYPTSIPNTIWRKRKGYSEPSLCKHLALLLPIVKFNAPTILKGIKKKYSNKFRKK
jgi:hypothetical protein